MTHIARFVPLVMLFVGTVSASDSFALEKSKRAILVVHGGAGTISRDQMTPEKEKLDAEVAKAPQRPLRITDRAPFE